MALYLITARLIQPRVSGIIEGRRKQVSGDLAEASRFKSESEQAMAAYEKALADAEKQIAATKSAAMANVRGIATEAAAAIVTRLSGVAAPEPAVAAAVDAVLKR